MHVADVEFLRALRRQCPHLSDAELTLMANAAFRVACPAHEGIRTGTLTDSKGFYNFPTLAIGTYDVGPQRTWKYIATRCRWRRKAHR